MWNDTDTPIAYLITCRTYGTWLYGDKRGSVSRHKNIFRTPKLRHESKWLLVNSDRLKGEPVILDAKQRKVIKDAILETCTIRRWGLMASNVRTNHLHEVISAPSTPAGMVMNAIKANATRKMRENGCWLSARSPWVDKGSTRYLWNQESVTRACNYVLYAQGEELPDFD